MTHYIVLWASVLGPAFEAVHYATSASEARRMHREMFPDDRIYGVKLYNGNGRFM